MGSFFISFISNWKSTLNAQSRGDGLEQESIKLLFYKKNYYKHTRAHTLTHKTVTYFSVYQENEYNFIVLRVGAIQIYLVLYFPVPNLLQFCNSYIFFQLLILTFFNVKCCKWCWNFYYNQNCLRNGEIKKLSFC